MRRSRTGEPFFGVFDPGTRGIHANGIPSGAAGVGALPGTGPRLDRASRDEPSLLPVVVPRRRQVK